MNNMTYKEFERLAGNLGYELFFEEEEVNLVKHNYYVIASVSTRRVGIMNTDTSDFSAIDIDKDEMLEIGDLCWRLASTPLKDREEQKRYYLKVKPRYNHLFSFGEIYLNYQRQNTNIFMSDYHENLHWQTQFTKEECEKLEKEYDLTILERVEVDDEELA